MAIFVIDTIKPKNNGSFRIMETMDIDHKGQDLQTVLESLDAKLEQVVADVEGSSTNIEIDVFDNVLCWRIGENEWKPLYDFSNVSGGGDVNEGEVYVGPDEPTDPNIKVWIRTNTGDDTVDTEIIEVPTKVSEIENDMGYITLSDLRNKLRLALSGDLLMLTYDGVMINSVNMNRIIDAVKK